MRTDFESGVHKVSSKTAKMEKTQAKNIARHLEIRPCPPYSPSLRRLDHHQDLLEVKQPALLVPLVLVQVQQEPTGWQRLNSLKTLGLMAGQAQH